MAVRKHILPDTLHAAAAHTLYVLCSEHPVCELCRHTSCVGTCMLILPKHCVPFLQANCVILLPTPTPPTRTVPIPTTEDRMRHERRAITSPTTTPCTDEYLLKPLVAGLHLFSQLPHTVTQCVPFRGQLLRRLLSGNEMVQNSEQTAHQHSHVNGHTQHARQTSA